MTQEQQSMLASIRQRSRTDDEWVACMERFKHTDFDSRLGEYLQYGNNPNIYWRTFIFVKSTELFPNFNHIPDDSVYDASVFVAQLKQHLTGFGKVRKNKEEHLIDLTHGRYHITTYSNKWALTTYDALRILRNIGLPCIYFHDSPEVTAKKLILMDELIGSEYIDDFEAVKFSIKKREKVWSLAKIMFETTLSEKMESRKYGLANQTWYSLQFVTYNINFGRGCGFDFSFPITDVDIGKLSDLLVQMYDLINTNNSGKT